MRCTLAKTQKGALRYIFMCINGYFFLIINSQICYVFMYVNN